MNGEANQAIRLDEDAVCEGCGRFGAYPFEGKSLCAECYEASGSCCPESETEELGSSEDNKA